jgi:putative flavoprotein involved in K+ transport
LPLESENIKQIHTAHYHNPADLNKCSVLVIGAGNSGAQIAVELAKDREVYLSVGHKIKYMPLQLIGKSIFYWFGKLGVLKADVDSKMGSFIRNQPDPIFGFELKEMIRLGKPIHQRGISPISGLYFVGLPWQYRRGNIKRRTN